MSIYLENDAPYRFAVAFFICDCYAILEAYSRQINFELKQGFKCCFVGYLHCDRVTSLGKYTYVWSTICELFLLSVKGVPSGFYSNDFASVCCPSSCGVDY